MKRGCGKCRRWNWLGGLWLAVGWCVAALPTSVSAQQFFPTPAFRAPQSQSGGYSVPSSGSYSQQAEILRERMIQRTMPSQQAVPMLPSRTQIPARTASAPATTPPQSSEQLPPPMPRLPQPMQGSPQREDLYPTQNRMPVHPPQIQPSPYSQPQQQQLQPRPQPAYPPQSQPIPYSQPQPQPAYAPQPQYQTPFQPPLPAPTPGVADNLKFPKLDEAVIFRDHPPSVPPGPIQPAPYSEQDFAPTQLHPQSPYDPQAELDTFGAKKMVRTQRPWVELFRPQYDTGPIPRYPEIFGPTNVFTPQLLVYGDYRMGGSYIDPGNGNDVEKIANRLNLDIDFKLTATERIHAFVDPFTNGNTFSSVVFGNGDPQFVNGLNGNFQTLFFEGDLGAIVGGAMGVDAPFDLPFTFGRIPLLFQNGIWMEDNFLGAAVSVTARNSPMLDWSNYDFTYFVAIDEITSSAFGTDDSAVNVYGSHWFIDAYKGYLEFGWAYLDDQTGQGLGYHNLGVSFQRRYFNAVSNAMRAIVNVGQDPANGIKTADGVVLLMENVFITESPYFKLPYLNLFAGFGHPQSVARNANAQGVLRNTGINFESDNLTNFPTLDNSANDTWGAAAGLDLLASDLSQQLIVEAAVVQVMGNDPLRIAKGNQYAAGLRYQRPLSNSWIFRADAMHGWRDNDTDITGARIALRHKF